MELIKETRAAKYVTEIDYEKFFDNLSWKKLRETALEEFEGVHRYMERILRAKIKCKDGNIITPDKGTPQGGVPSPMWAARTLHRNVIKKLPTGVKVTAYLDDVVAVSEEPIELKWFESEEAGIKVNAKKTKITKEMESGKKR